MRNKFVAVCFGLALTVAAFGATGGFPTRPRFTSVGVNAAAPATGNLTASGTITATDFVGTVNGVASSDFARKSTTNTFSASQTVQVSGAAGVIVTAALGTDNPTVRIARTAGITAQWDIYSPSGSTELRFARIGDALRISDTDILVSGVSVCRADGTNCNVLSATNLTSGTVPDARLSGTYTGAMTFSALSAVTATTGTFTTATVGGSNVCRADGTNCPSSSQFAITCTTACNVSTLAVGQSAIIRTTAGVSVTSNTTQANDTDLQFTNLPVGTYAVWGNTNWTGSGGGLKFDFLYSGTISASTSNAVYFTAQGASGAGCLAGSTLINQNILTAVTGAYSCTTYAGSFGRISISDGDSNLVATSTGTLSMSWAQNASNATATQRLVGSWWALRRIL